MSKLLTGSSGASQVTREAGRFYTRDSEPGRRYRSVTTFLSQGIAKPFLINWSAGTAADYALDNWDELASLPRDEARKRIAGAHRAKRDSAADIGSKVHDYIEAHIKDEPRPKAPLEVVPYLEEFKRWADAYEAEFEAAECQVFNRTHSYAGTLDAVATISYMGKEGEAGRMKLVLDWKTSAKGPYPESELQLAAYRRAEFADIHGEEVPLPAGIVGGAVLRLVPGKTALMWADTSDAMFDAFLAVMEVVDRPNKDRRVLDKEVPAIPRRS